MLFRPMFARCCPILVVLGLLAGPAWGAPPLRLVATEQGFQFQQGESPVLFYQRRAKAEQGKFRRAHYVHPLRDLDGEVWSEDFPSDHLHHRGIFWAWHQLRVDGKAQGDGWVCENFEWDVQDAETAAFPDGSVGLRVQVVWKSSAGKDTPPQPLVRESTVIRLFPDESEQGVERRVVDFEIELQALVPKLELGGSADAKGYGGFSTRIQTDAKTRFLGKQGKLEPVRTAIAAGAWVNVVQEQRGLAILCHPSLPGHPQPWLIRQQRSMQNPAWPGRESTPLPHDQPTLLRYRLVIHDGVQDPQQIEAWYQQYAPLPRTDGKWKKAS